MKKTERIPKHASDRVVRGHTWDFMYAVAWPPLPKTDSFGLTSEICTPAAGIRLVEEVEDTKSIPSASRSLGVLRGGCWNDHPQAARVAYLYISGVGMRSNYLGIRLVEEAIDE
jgi:hypothetical protein